MSNPTLPPLPYQTPVTDQNGIITASWSKWFQQLFLRAGGFSAPSNSAITSNQTLVAALQATVTALQTSVTTLQTSMLQVQTGLTQGRDL